MLKECSGPLNFHSFISLFAEKIGSSDPESVVINAYSCFDPEDTGTLRERPIKKDHH
jgi:Ca2+-binding EF-hand superfamily protein